MNPSDQLHVYIWSDERENNCNSVFIDGRVPLLIDPGHRQRVDLVLNRMKQDGIEPARIKAIICTHGHPDHFEGTLAFKDAPIKIGLSLQEHRYVEETGRPLYARRGMEMPDYRVDFYLKEGELVLGKVELQVLLTPGHTPGGLSLYWPRHKILISGDMVFQRSIGRVDLPGGDVKAMKESVEKLSRLPVDLLIPGHGPAIQGADRVKENFQYLQRAFFGGK
jgi:hydroxyacylglutathione hydrolase